MKGEIDIIIHATENSEKVLSSTKKTLGIELSKRDIKRRDLSGHYGNPIIYLSIKLSETNIKKMFSSIKNKMPQEEINLFLNSLEEYFHDSSLYFRLDKQNLCQGGITFTEEDSIKIVVKNVNRNLIEKWLTSNE
jgi:RNA binding exosome subunit